MSNLSVNTITDASGGSTASINGLTPQASNMAATFNRVINGAMTIDQRNAGASVTPSVNGQYTLDRWRGYHSQVSKYSVQQNAGSVTPPVGFTNYLGVTSLSAYSVGASEIFGIQQFIEGFNVADLGWGTANAQAVTLSFKVYSSLTGTFGGVLQNDGQNRSYPFTYAISSANTWTTISITVAGDTSGTWLANNLRGITVWFNLGTGSSLSGTAGAWAGAGYFSATGATSVVGTSGATFYITGVQLEAGSTASSFAHENVGDTLRKCERYYWKIQGDAASNAYVAVGSGLVWSTTEARIYTKFPATMRAAPTFSLGSPLRLAANGTFDTTSIATTWAGNKSAMIQFNASGLSTGNGLILHTLNTSTSYLQADAEL